MLGVSSRLKAQWKVHCLILLDTNAFLWLNTQHRKVRVLRDARQPFALSPATLLELQFLQETGRIRFNRQVSLSDVAADPRWLVDEPPSTVWFEKACELSWTRDPFDRLIAAHGLLRGWRIATGDAAMVQHLPERNLFEL